MFNHDSLKFYIPFYIISMQNYILAADSKEYRSAFEEDDCIYMSFDDEMNNWLISAVDELPVDDYFEELSFSYSDEVNENINETHKLMPVSDNYFAMDDCIYDDL